MGKYTKVISYCITFMLVIIGLGLSRSNDKLKRELSLQKQNYRAINDSLHTKYNKDSSKTYSILVIQGEKVSDLEGMINSKDSALLELSSIVKQYKGKQLQSASNFHSQTGIHTLTPTVYHLGHSNFIDSGWSIKKSDSELINSLVFESNIHLGQITDKVTGKKTDKYWVNGYSIATSNETMLDLVINNDYSVLIGYDKHKVPYAEVTTFNPFDTIKSVKVYDIVLPKPSKYGIDIVGGYGLMATSDGRVYHGLSLTIGLGRRLITFGKK